MNKNLLLILTERGIHQSKSLNNMCINDTTSRNGYTPVGM